MPLADAPDCRVVAFRSDEDGLEHLAIVVGRPEALAPPLVRIHGERFGADLFETSRNDGRPGPRDTIRRMAEEGAGILLHLAREGRGLGRDGESRLVDRREYALAVAILRMLGVARIRLSTDDPGAADALARGGIVVEHRSRPVGTTNLSDPRAVDAFA